MNEVFGKLIPYWWHLYMTSATVFIFTTGIAIYLIGVILWVTGRIGE